MAVRVLILLGILACLTTRQIPAWGSDVALWSAAVAVNTTSPRPAYNLALALRKDGRMVEAADWLVRAADRASGHPREADYRRAVRLQFEAIELTGLNLCALPQLQPYCYS